MSDTKKNALAELAEWVERQKDVFPVLEHQFKWQDDRDEKNIEKVQRIISELAKVKDPDYADVAGLRFIVKNCRAIAEE